MKYLKYLIFTTLLYIFIIEFYSYLISPTVTVINNTNNIIRITKGEFDNSKSDPDLNEVESMYSNIVSIIPEESYSYDISMKSMLSEKSIRVDVSYEKKESTSGRSFMIGRKGSCKFKINIYREYTDIETYGLNICYKRLPMIKDNL